MSHLLKKVFKTYLVNCLFKKTRIDLYEIRYKSLGCDFLASSFRGVKGTYAEKLDVLFCAVCADFPYCASGMFNRNMPLKLATKHLKYCR